MFAVAATTRNVHAATSGDHRVALRERWHSLSPTSVALTTMAAHPATTTPASHGVRGSGDGQSPIPVASTIAQAIAG
ncbi:Uncharacterised protein [Mycobacteroides abscessus subsp. abscessus]|nr:Uncharacterised protein [Mycobacteroides abscessus subsp. abscessus]